MTLKEKQKISIDLFIEAAVIDEEAEHPYLESSTPILLVPEYSIPIPYSYVYRDLKIKHEYTDYIHSGFLENEKGIILSDELRQIAARKQQGDKNYLTEAWSKMDIKIAKIILQNNNTDQYHQQTDLSLEYSNNMPSTHESSCLHFLQIHQAFKVNSAKNQDIIALGNEADKKNALRKMLPELQAAGFGKISYFNIVTGKEEILYDDKKPPQKIYRLLFAKGIEHQQMMALHAISDDLCGITGDQSFSEAFSANKLIVYETRSHKKAFIGGYLEAIKKQLPPSAKEYIQQLQAHSLPDGRIQLANQSTRDKDWPKRLIANTWRLAYLLINACTIFEYQELKALFKRQEINDYLMLLKNINLALAKKTDLMQHVTSYLTPQQQYFKKFVTDSPENQLRIAIMRSDVDAASALIDQGIDLTRSNFSGVNCLLLSIQQQQWPILDKMIEKLLTTRPENLQPIFQPNVIGQTALNFIPRQLEQTQPKLFHTLQLIVLKAGLEEITTYQPSEKSPRLAKRSNQLALLQELKNLSIEYSDNDKEKVQVILGFLLLIRDSIRKEFRGSTSQLLAKVEYALQTCGINPNNAELKRTSYSVLQKFVEREGNERFLQNATLIKDLRKHAGLTPLHFFKEKEIQTDQQQVTKPELSDEKQSKP